MKVRVYVTLRKGVLDPQGRAVEEALHSLGFKEARGVRMGKYIEMELDCPSKERAEEVVKGMCERLLANPVIEDYRFEVEDGTG